MCMRRLVFADYPGFHAFEMQSIFFFLHTILELRHYNEVYRDLIKCCPIRLRVFSEIKHASTISFY